MPITSIRRDATNNVSIVRITATETLAQVDDTDYILNQMDIIQDLNDGFWQWYSSDVLLIAASDGNGFFQFTDTSFSTLVLIASSTDGTVSSGLQDQIAIYPADGTTVTGSSTLPALVQASPNNFDHGTNATADMVLAGDGTWQQKGKVEFGLENQILHYPADGYDIRGTFAFPAEVQIPVGSLNNGTNASGVTFWAGDGAWKTISSIINTSPFSKYVSSGGNDTTGNGSINEPYATITKALSVITDNSSTNRYTIFHLGGTIVEAAGIAIKPFVSIASNAEDGAMIDPNGTIVLDSSWGTTTAGEFTLSNINFRNFDMNLDFSSFSNSTTHLIHVNNVNSNGRSISVLGSANTVPNLFINNSIIYGAVIQSALATLNCNEITIILSGNIPRVANSVIYSIGNHVTGNIALTGDVSGPITSHMYLLSTKIDGTLTITNPNAIVSTDVSSYISPTIVGGGVIALLNPSDGMNANYFPTFYTPVSTPPTLDTSVKAHLQGIDNKLALLPPGPYTYTYIYVSSFGGVDAVGNGSANKPYATISYALSQITDATSSKLYFLQCYGVFSETTLNLKPFIYLDGANSSLTVTNPIGKDAAWGTAGGDLYFSNFKLNAGITMDFSASSGNINLYFSGLYQQGASKTFSITGGSNATNVKWVNSYSTIAGKIGTSLTYVNTANTYTQGVVLGTVSINNGFGGNNDIIGCFWDTSRTVTLTSSGVGIIINNLIGNAFFGNVTLALVRTNSLVFANYVNNAAQLFALSLNGTGINVQVDTLSVTPTFSGGASDSNIIYASLASSITSGFTPNNYTAANARVQAHLQGIDTQLGVISPSTNSFIYRWVSSTNGVDAVGNGSILKPYATISYALSQITDNTSAKRYILFCEGIFTETTITMKPWVLLEGDGSFLTVDTWALDSGFTTANALFYVNNFILAASGLASTMSLSFTSGNNPRIIITNMKPLVRFFITVNGPTSGNANCFISNNQPWLSIGTNYCDITANNTSGIIDNNLIRVFNLTSSGASGAHSLYTSGNKIISIGAVNINTTSTGTISVLSNDIYQGVPLAFASNTGSATFRAKGCDGFNSVSISGAAAVLTPDILSVTPSFSSGAVDGTNCVYPVLSASITAGFSPTAYTATNTRVRSHLEGINTALLSNINSTTEVTSTTQAAVVGGEYIANNASLVTVTLPATAALGAKVRVMWKGAGGWRVTANTGQTIRVGASVSSSSGTVTSTASGDCIEVVCITANTTWEAISIIGNLTVA